MNFASWWISGFEVDTEVRSDRERGQRAEPGGGGGDRDDRGAAPDVRRRRRQLGLPRDERYPPGHAVEAVQVRVQRQLGWGYTEQLIMTW